MTTPARPRQERPFGIAATALLAVVAAPPVIMARAADNAAAQANNPLASTTSLNFQNQFIGRLSGFREPANAGLLRGAQPFSIGESNWIARATPPVNTYPTQSDGPHETGLGDFNIFAAYRFDTGNPGISVGIGPQLTAPTANASIGKSYSNSA